jgi:chitodextrinase
MKAFITNLGVSALAIAIVAIPAFALAQEALVASIDTPSDGATFEVGEDINFSGSATGGDDLTYTYSWSWDDGASQGKSGQDVTHSFSTTGSKVITLRVTDASLQTTTEDITIDIVEESEALTIRNVSFSNLTENSVTITWDTNFPSTSQVIYDTVSHTDEEVEAAGAPKYGYAFASSKDTALVTSHSVELTGLTPDTQYFFRVISTR